MSASSAPSLQQICSQQLVDYFYKELNSQSFNLRFPTLPNRAPGFPTIADESGEIVGDMRRTRNRAGFPANRGRRRNQAARGSGRRFTYCSSATSAAGVTPEMREAAPSVAGRAAASLPLISADRPPIAA